MSHFCLLVTLFFNMKFQDFCQRNSEYPSKLLLKKDKVWPLQSIQQPWPTYPGPGFGQCYSSLCCSFWDWTQSLLYQKQHLRLFMMGIPNSETTRLVFSHFLAIFDNFWPNFGCFWDWTQSLLYQKQHLQLIMMGIPNSETTR